MAQRPRQRLLGYVRVSRVAGREGDSFISPAQQDDRIRSWCQAYGHRLIDVQHELDESGARADRPKLLNIIERVERGEADGIVVARLDRFGRSLVDGLALIDRITAPRDRGGADGTFVSVADGFDLTTDTGRLVLQIMLSLGEFELARIRGNWSDAKARAVARGVHPSARPPFGYQRNAKGQPLSVHPANGPLVTQLFTRRADGAGYTALSDWLEERGAVTMRGRPRWSMRAVKDITRNPVYLGVAFSGDHRNEAAHPPLTDPVTFRRAQRPGVAVVPKADPSPIRPLLRCAGCRYAMRAERRRYANGHAWLFTCRNHGGAKSSQRCDRPASIKDTGQLETYIAQAFLDGLPAFAAKRRAEAPDVDDLRLGAAFAREAFEQWRDDTSVQQRLGMTTYLDGLAARQDTLNDKLAALARAEAAAEQVLLPADVTALRRQWPDLPPAEQRELLQAGLRCVFIRGRSSHPAPVDLRARLVWRSEDVDLPVRGAWRWGAEPFLFDDGLDDDFTPQPPA